MIKICDDVNQTELMRFWLQELTSFSPEQVEVVVETLCKDQGTQARSLML